MCPSVHIHLFQLFWGSVFPKKSSLASSSLLPLSSNALLLPWTRPPTWLPGEAASGNLFAVSLQGKGRESWVCKLQKQTRNPWNALGMVWFSPGREKEEQQLMSCGTPGDSWGKAPHVDPFCSQSRKPQKNPFFGTAVLSLSRCSLRGKGQILLLLWEFGETEAGGGEVPVSAGPAGAGKAKNPSGIRL